MDYGIAVKAHMNHGNVRGIWTYLRGKWKYKTTSEFSLCIHHLILWGNVNFNILEERNSILFTVQEAIFNIIEEICL